MADIRLGSDEGVQLARRAAELRDDDALAVGIVGFALEGRPPSGRHARMSNHEGGGNVQAGDRRDDQDRTGKT
jgi:hypothetical protein